MRTTEDITPDIAIGLTLICSETAVQREARLKETPEFLPTHSLHRALPDRERLGIKLQTLWEVLNCISVRV